MIAFGKGIPLALIAAATISFQDQTPLPRGYMIDVEPELLPLRPMKVGKARFNVGAADFYEKRRAKAKAGRKARLLNQRKRSGR